MQPSAGRLQGFVYIILTLRARQQPQRFGGPYTGHMSGQSRLNPWGESTACTMANPWPMPGNPQVETGGKEGMSNRYVGPVQAWVSHHDH